MNSFSSIDLDKVKNIITEYCAIADSKDFIINEEVSFNPLVIKNNLKQSKEALDLLNKDFNISFDGIDNINSIFDKSKKDICLNGIELVKVLTFHNHCVRIKSKINSIEDDITIKDYAEAISINSVLANKIEKVVDNNGNIKEDASNRLKEIFYQINKNGNDIHSASMSFLSKYGNSLQEQNVFSRNDRTVFLFKNSDKNKFNGFQYGTSSSGLATYLEPEAFIELNNRKQQLENDKLEEVNRILREVSYVVASFADSYMLNFASLVKLDVIFSKAKYGFYKCGVLANISENHLFIKDGAHPLIDEDKVVLNTYELENKYQGIVISGTNTGGKTVGLKLIGLSVLMSYLGIPVISSFLEVPIYDAIFIDIDDNQSISNALSTFSAHITNINNILNNATNHSLILIDELISGTDPKEAQAISLSILEKILEIRSKFVITTHYDDIKQFAYNNENILLSSVGFDLDNLRPTYKYLENSVGVSNAIDIASKYFDDERLIINARKYINLNKTKEDELLDKLANEIRINEILKENLNNQISINNHLNEELQEKINTFELEKTAIRNKYVKELNDYIDNLKIKADEKLELLNEEKNKNVFINQVEELRIEKVKFVPEKFEIGDNVRVGESSQNGEIVSISGTNVSININGMIVKTKLKNLTKLPKIEKKEYTPRKRMDRVSRELNLVGERVEDALVILDDYLDRAYGSGLTSVKIIHGFGTGQLRKGIREHLKKIKIVNSFDNGDAYDGGSNVTIVRFK